MRERGSTRLPSPRRPLLPPTHQPHIDIRQQRAVLRPLISLNLWHDLCWVARALKRESRRRRGPRTGPARTRAAVTFEPEGWSERCRAPDIQRLCFILYCLLKLPFLVLKIPQYPGSRSEIDSYELKSRLAIHPARPRDRENPTFSYNVLLR